MMKDLLERFVQSWDYLEKIAYYSNIGHFEDRGRGILVDGYYNLGSAHADLVLYLARYPAGDIQPG